MNDDLYMSQMKPNEIWIGNTKTSNGLGWRSEIKSARLGEQAFCIDRKKLSTDYVLPIFINKSDQPKHDSMYAERMNAKKE